MAPAVAAPASAQGASLLRDQYRLEKARIFAPLLEGANGAHPHAQVQGALSALSALTDRSFAALWNGSGLADAGYALVAVGGYGRGELFPYSDIDVLVLAPGEAVTPQDAPRIEAFIGTCWDAGLEIGSSVRTVDDCLRESAADVTVQTSLLEARLLAGDPTLYGAFSERFKAALDPRSFYTAKLLEMRQRHTKYENTPYALEPNCKESPGGLRDLHVITWVARAAGLGDSWRAMQAQGLATPREARQLRQNELELKLLRTRLHLLAGRREDRLVFDFQTRLAESYGLAPADAAAVPGGKRPSELLMRRYYWVAKAVVQLNQILMLNVGERLAPQTHELRRLNERFFEKAGMIEIASDDLYEREPGAILETFLVYEQTVGVKGLSSRTLRALYNARSLMNGTFRHDPRNRAMFMRILQAPQGITHAMRLMNQTSVLGRYLWVFRRIVGQMQHDLFHVYTVDQHILMVLRNVRRFFLPEHGHEYPLCSQLAAGFEKPWLLYVAALFHDIAKGRGGDHSALGSREVRRFCRDHGITGEDASLCEFLVAEHLTMSETAQKQDLSDPDVIQAFAARVGSERRLTALYLLTVADIRGTSPKVWNAWKGKLIEDLYRITLRALGGSAPDADTLVANRKREALKELARLASPHEVEKALWAQLDVGYFARHDAADIAWHTRHISRHLDTRRALVRARQSPLGEGLQVLVYAPDQSDLFARICGFFARRGFSILDARVHTTKSRYALDHFQVITEELPEHYQELATMVEQALARVIDEAGPLPAPTRARVSRRVRHFPVAPRVELRPDEKAQSWILDVSASDQPGLLYRIARVLAAHAIDVQLAKVVTLGERVEDSFLVRGAELQHNRSQIALETELLAAVTPV